MRSRENYTPFVTTGFGLTLAILLVFQVYIVREPSRIQVVESADRAEAVKAGRDLYADNCVACHGATGEGKAGPALNSSELLKMTADQTFFSLIRSGIPGTVMPAWGQTFGGPFTDEQVTQLVAFVRAWEPTAPQIIPVVIAPDPVRGATIFANTCFTCHGENGKGTTRAPALNDLTRLKEFDDLWYRNTISRGRPAKGMPTWGTVLSPMQINDVVALLAAWRQGQTIAPAAVSNTKHLSNALFALRQFDSLDAVFYLSAASSQADASKAKEIRAVIDLIKANHLFEAESRLIALLPPTEMGKELYESNCAPCHESDGSGGLGKRLLNNKFIQSKSDKELVSFILTGRKGTAMNGFKNIIGEDELINVVALMRVWQK
ncbi:MAG: c-type cytochrome [Chloroflexi bacterium]|nr:c-type cytochrome [Chloroflexota bacterium]MBI5349829.1 c-type cytochrome [Chloroflexota bacterium]